jgi:hypothetical protein
MFATLVGTNTQNAAARSLLTQLQALASSAGFEAPTDSLRVRPDGPTEGWVVELLGPASQRADFMLSVLAPKVPGISPIYPFYKTIDGPLFAVTVLPRAFGISREDRREFAEVATTEDVCREFEEFLCAGVKTHQTK